MPELGLGAGAFGGRGGEDRAVDGDADEGDERGAQAADLGVEDLHAAADLGGGQLVGAAGHAGAEVGHGDAPVLEARLLLGLEEDRGEARGVEQLPERVARVGEVMAT